MRLFLSVQYKVLLYSLDGRLLSTYSAYEWSLGVKAVTWSPSSQFLAIGSYDEKVMEGQPEQQRRGLIQERKQTLPPLRSGSSITSRGRKWLSWSTLPASTPPKP